MSAHTEIVLGQIPTGGRSKRRGFFHFCPTFVLVFIAFVAAKLLTPAMWKPFFTWGEFAICSGYLVYLLTIICIFFEISKVAEPKVNNAREVKWIIAIAIALYIIPAIAALVAKAVTSYYKIVDPGLTFAIHLFYNFEYLSLVFIAMLLWPTATTVNNNTLQVQVGQVTTS